MKTAKIITPRSVLISFVGGAIAGTIGDFCHVWTATDGYPFFAAAIAATTAFVRFLGTIPPIPFLPAAVPLWVPLLMGSAGVMLVHSQRLMGLGPDLKLGHKSELRALMGPIAFVALYALSGFMTLPAGGIKDVILALLVGLFWWTADRNLKSLGFAIVAAIAGTLFEIFIVQNGVFFYHPTHSNLMGVPSWLPTLYIMASLGVRQAQAKI